MDSLNNPQKPSIEGLSLIEKNIFKNEKGAVLKHLSTQDSEFEKFGEVYYSVTYPKQIKGWKYHLRKELSLVVIHGEVQFVFFDDRDSSKTKGNIVSYKISRSNYKMIRLPAQIWYSFKCTSETEAIIANCTNHPHEPEEAIEKSLSSSKFPYQWT